MRWITVTHRWTSEHYWGVIEDTKQVLRTQGTQQALLPPVPTATVSGREKIQEWTLNNISSNQNGQKRFPQLYTETVLGSAEYLKQGSSVPWRMNHDLNNTFWLQNSCWKEKKERDQLCKCVHTFWNKSCGEYLTFPWKMDRGGGQPLGRAPAQHEQGRVWCTAPQNKTFFSTKIDGSFLLVGVWPLAVGIFSSFTLL